MSDALQAKLAQLYLQKGKLVTELELMQQQLQMTNQEIVQVRNSIVQQQEQQPETEEKPVDE